MAGQLKTKLQVPSEIIFTNNKGFETFSPHKEKRKDADGKTVTDYWFPTREIIQKLGGVSAANPESASAIDAVVKQYERSIGV